MISKTKMSGNDLPKAKKVEHFIRMFDFSGSMDGVMSQLRDYMLDAIENKLPNNSFLTVGYFSSQGDHGIILDRFRVGDEDDKVHAVKKLKEKFKSRGLTAFVGGLKEVFEASKKMKASDDAVNIVEFITDGYDNSSNSRKEILERVKECAELASSFSVVEFGDYCNHDLLVEMADVASEFCASQVVYTKPRKDWFEPVFDKLSEISGSGKMVEVDAPSWAKFAIAGFGQYKAVSDKSKIPADADAVYFIGEETTEVPSDLALHEYYLLAYHAGLRYHTESVYALLAKTGDKYAWRLWDNAIGKQRINEALAHFKECVTDESKRYIEGKSDSLKSNPDAFSLLDALELLQKDEEAVYYPYTEYGFKCTPITQPKRQRTSVATQEELQKIEELSKAGNWSELQDLVGSKFELKFVRDGEPAQPFDRLVFNSSEGRANLSLNSVFSGTVDLSKASKGKYGIIRTYRYKNLAIIHDGKVNADVLPINASKETLEVLANEGALEDKGGYYHLMLNKLPVTNRNSSKNISAYDIANDYWNMVKFQGQYKVINDFITKNYPKKTDNALKELYGEDGAKELSELYGFTYNGFQPKTVAIGDFSEEPYSYLNLSAITGAKGGELKYESVAAVLKKDPSKWNIADSIMGKEIKEMEAILNTAGGDASKVRELFDAKKKFVTNLKRAKEYEIAKKQFAMILTKRWFSDLDPNDSQVVVKDPEHGDITIRINYGSTE